MSSSSERENAWQQRLRLVGPRDLQKVRGERACKTCEGCGCVTDAEIPEPWSGFVNRVGGPPPSTYPVQPVACPDCWGLGTHVSSLEVYTPVCDQYGDGKKMPEKPCNMCEGSGYISTSPPGEPWGKVLGMTLGEALEAKLGVIEPAICPICGGSGERRSQ